MDVEYSHINIRVDDPKIKQRYHKLSHEWQSIHPEDKAQDFLSAMMDYIET